MSHANAALTPRHRKRIGRYVVEKGWTISAAAAYFHVSWPTAQRWAKRYAEMGTAGMRDRSSRLHRSPAKTPQALAKKIVHLRWKKRLGPVQIGGIPGIPAPTVHVVLVRCRLNRLSHVGEPIRRYEHDTRKP